MTVTLTVNKRNWKHCPNILCDFSVSTVIIRSSKNNFVCQNRTVRVKVCLCSGSDQGAHLQYSIYVRQMTPIVIRHTACWKCASWWEKSLMNSCFYYYLFYGGCSWSVMSLQLSHWSLVLKTFLVSFLDFKRLKIFAVSKGQASSWISCKMSEFVD